MLISFCTLPGMVFGASLAHRSASQPFRRRRASATAVAMTHAASFLRPCQPALTLGTSTTVPVAVTYRHPQKSAGSCQTRAGSDTRGDHSSMSEVKVRPPPPRP